jgi:uncharacterized protein (DUF2267 family)
MIRGFFFEGGVPKETPIKEGNAEDFVAFIGQQMRDTAKYRGREDIKCMFDLLNARFSRGEVEDARANLSKDLRDLWPVP